jgi:hypothetical protein
MTSHAPTNASASTDPDGKSRAVEDKSAFIRRMNYILWMSDKGGCEPPQQWQEAYTAGYEQRSHEVRERDEVLDAIPQRTPEAQPVSAAVVEPVATIRRAENGGIWIQWANNKTMFDFIGVDLYTAPSATPERSEIPEAVRYECGYCGEPLESDRVVSCAGCGKMTHRHGIKTIVGDAASTAASAGEAWNDEGPIFEIGTTVEHRKTGGHYIIESIGLIEATGTVAYGYRSKSTGMLWFRPRTEMEDGRFFQIARPAAPVITYEGNADDDRGIGNRMEWNAGDQGGPIETAAPVIAPVDEWVREAEEYLEERCGSAGQSNEDLCRWLRENNYAYVAREIERLNYEILYYKTMLGKANGSTAAPVIAPGDEAETGDWRDM